MPVTFYMTNDQKPLLIIHDENNKKQSDITRMFTADGYQEPEIVTSYDNELDAQGISKNNRIVIFANKRIGQSYKDPTIAQILNVLNSNGIKTDKAISERFIPLMAFAENLRIDPSLATFFEEGDRISPLIIGLQEYLDAPSPRSDGLVLVEAFGNGYCLFNAIAIALAARIINNEVDKFSEQPGYKMLLQEFANNHKNFHFDPLNYEASWREFKVWIKEYGNSGDIQRVFAPVLFSLNKKYNTSNSQNQKEAIIREIAQIAFRHERTILNDFLITGKADWHKINLLPGSAVAIPLAPILDNLEIADRKVIINHLITLLQSWNNNIEFTIDNLKLYIRGKLNQELEGIIVKINQLKSSSGFTDQTVSRMMNGLLINLIVNSQSGNQENPIAISLDQREGHFNAFVDESVHDRFKLPRRIHNFNPAVAYDQLDSNEIRGPVESSNAAQPVMNVPVLNRAPTTHLEQSPLYEFFDKLWKIKPAQLHDFQNTHFYDRSVLLGWKQIRAQAIRVGILSDSEEANLAKLRAKLKIPSQDGFDENTVISGKFNEIIPRIRSAFVEEYDSSFPQVSAIDFWLLLLTVTECIRERAPNFLSFHAIIFQSINPEEWPSFGGWVSNPLFTFATYCVGDANGLARKVYDDALNALLQRGNTVVNNEMFNINNNNNIPTPVNVIPPVRTVVALVPKIEPTPGRAGAFNAMAIGLAIGILSGEFDSQKDEPIFRALLDEFAMKNIAAATMTWSQLKIALNEWNAKEDIEAQLAPVLFQMTYKNILLAELKYLKNKALLDVDASWAILTTDLKCTRLNILLTGVEGANLLARLRGASDIDAQLVDSVWAIIKKNILDAKRPEYDRTIQESDVEAMMSSFSLASIAGKQAGNINHGISLKKEGFKWVVNLDPRLSAHINQKPKQLKADLDANFKWPECIAPAPVMSAVAPASAQVAANLPQSEMRRLENIAFQTPPKTPAISLGSAPPAGDSGSHLITQLSIACSAYCRDKVFFSNKYDIEASRVVELLTLVNTVGVESFSDPDHFKETVLALILGKLSRLQNEEKFKNCLEIFKARHLSLLNLKAPNLEFDRSLNTALNFSDESFNPQYVFRLILTHYRTNYPDTVNANSNSPDPN